MSRLFPKIDRSKFQYRLVDDSPMSPIQQDATDLFEEKSTARVEKEIPIQFVYEEDESSKVKISEVIVCWTQK